MHLTDFGFAKNTKDSKRIESQALKGSYDYMAPEILGDMDNKDNSKRDVWSIGVIGYELCTFKLPFATIPAILTAT